MPTAAARSGRPQVIPPAPTPLAPFGLLALSPEPLALATFQFVRAVFLWAETPDLRRPALFRRVNETVRQRTADAVDSAPHVAAELATLATFREMPGSASPQDVGRACFGLWEWADRSGMLEIALHFAEAAAYADSEQPRYATEAGRMAQLSGNPALRPRAEQWLARAAALALRARNRVERVRALTHKATLLADLGRLDEAVAVCNRAATLAAHGSRRRAAIAHHYLLGLHLTRGELHAAQYHAAAAFGNYRKQDERLPALAHDFAVLLVALKLFSPALHLLHVAVPLLERPDEQCVPLATIAEAAAGMGRVARFEKARDGALSLLHTDPYRAPAALLKVARGALLLGDQEAAKQHAHRAGRLAREMKDPNNVRDAVRFLRTIQRGTRDAGPATADGYSPALALARRFAARLQARQTPGRTLREHATASGSLAA